MILDLGSQHGGRFPWDSAWTSFVLVADPLLVVKSGKRFDLFCEYHHAESVISSEPGQAAIWLGCG